MISTVKNCNKGYKIASYLLIFFVGLCKQNEKMIKNKTKHLYYY